MNSKGEQNEPATSASLDLFSTSPTKEDLCSSFPSQKCRYNAPYFAYKTEGKIYGIVQGNCHHWDCPRCGIGRAKQEYGRIVEGCRHLAKHGQLFFITITCKGRELGVKEAEANYLTWTNRLLDACRQRCKRSGGQWVYVQVTERQKRSHPHSHILTTFNTGDTVQGTKESWITDRDGKRKKQSIECLRSEWLYSAIVRSGLGEQYDISEVETVEGASRYVAKYLFKDSIFTTDWPPRWKRVRYSQSFPKLPERKSEAFVLLQHADWYTLASKAVVVNCPDLDAFETAKNQMHFHDVIIRLKTKKEDTKNDNH